MKYEHENCSTPLKKGELFPDRMNWADDISESSDFVLLGRLTKNCIWLLRVLPTQQLTDCIYAIAKIPLGRDRKALKKSTELQENNE